MQEKSSKNKEERSRSWCFVMYPESAPENWREILADYSAPYAVSPLHDSDINPDGEPKKPHWHVTVAHQTMKSFAQVRELTDRLNATIPQRVANMVGNIRYMIHKDNPEKAQYEKSDIITGCGFDIENYLATTKSEKRAIMREIYAFVREQNIDEFCDLMDYAFDNEPEWFDYLTDGHSIMLAALFQSRRGKKANNSLT